MLILQMRIPYERDSTFISTVGQIYQKTVRVNLYIQFVMNSSHAQLIDGIQLRDIYTDNLECCNLKMASI